MKRIVYASTSGTIGCSRDNITISDDAPYCHEVVGSWPYCLSKIESEERALKYATKHHLEVIFMRPTVMLGPGDVRFRAIHFIVREKNCHNTHFYKVILS